MTEPDYITRTTKGTKGAPLVVTFHGTGGDETQFHGLAEQLWPGAHIVSPRGDVLEHGMNRYFRRTGEGVYDMDDMARRRNAMTRFVRAQTAMAGATRVIALGYSNGANIAAAVALAAPEVFTDVIALHPLIPWAPDPHPGLAKTRWLITAGERDPICPAPVTQRLIAFLKTRTAEVTEHWHPGGHEVMPSEIQALQNFLT